MTECNEENCKNEALEGKEFCEEHKEKEE